MPRSLYRSVLLTLSILVSVPGCDSDKNAADSASKSSAKKEQMIASESSTPAPTVTDAVPAAAPVVNTEEAPVEQAAEETEAVVESTVENKADTVVEAKAETESAPASQAKSASQVVASPPIKRKTVYTDEEYFRAAWDPIHFKPAIDSAVNDDCLVCHQEVLDRKVRESTIAGVKTSETLAWYQTLETYQGEQDTFHRRHLVTPYASQVMDLKCNTCHQGNDPREETANSSATGSSELTQRKHVDPMICVMCHGKHNGKIMGVPPGDWRETGEAFKYNCLICHAAIRVNRHKVNFLKADAIESMAKENTDVCFGCHGGRAWYRINYPYPRHNWPGAGDKMPEWAKSRPTESEPRFLIGVDGSGG